MELYQIKKLLQDYPLGTLMRNLDLRISDLTGYTHATDPRIHEDLLLYSLVRDVSFPCVLTQDVWDGGPSLNFFLMGIDILEPGIFGLLTRNLPGNGRVKRYFVPKICGENKDGIRRVKSIDIIEPRLTNHRRDAGSIHQVARSSSIISTSGLVDYSAYYDLEGKINPFYTESASLDPVYSGRYANGVLSLLGQLHPEVLEMLKLTEVGVIDILGQYDNRNIANIVTKILDCIPIRA